MELRWIQDRNRVRTGMRVKLEPGPKLFLDRNQESLVLLIYGFKALTEGIYHNINIELSKQKM